MPDLAAHSDRKRLFYPMKNYARIFVMMLSFTFALAAWGEAVWAQESATQENAAEATIDERINTAVQPVTNAISAVLFSGFEFSNDATTHNDMRFEGVALFNPAAGATSADGRERVTFPFIVPSPESLP